MFMNFSKYFTRFIYHMYQCIPAVTHPIVLITNVEQYGFILGDFGCSFGFMIYKKARKMLKYD